MQTRMASYSLFSLFFALMLLVSIPLPCHSSARYILGRAVNRVQHPRLIGKQEHTELKAMLLQHRAARAQATGAIRQRHNHQANVASDALHRMQGAVRGGG